MPLVTQWMHLITSCCLKQKLHLQASSKYQNRKTNNAEKYKSKSGQSSNQVKNSDCQCQCICSTLVAKPYSFAYQAHATRVGRASNKAWSTKALLRALYIGILYWHNRATKLNTRQVRLALVKIEVAEFLKCYGGVLYVTDVSWGHIN